MLMDDEALVDRVSIATDALVIGAGPAGSSAATLLARRGIDVVLVDRLTFPRDKACGDALIPDALAALDALGLGDAALRPGRRLNGVEIHAPSGTSVRLHGRCAAVPRVLFDDVLRTAAVEAGARFLAPFKGVGPLRREGAYAGARLRRTDTAAVVDVHARWTILATGASSEALRAFNIATRMEASATAARLYLTVPETADLPPYLVISFGRHIAPGYGWVFPGPDGIVNVGVGVFHDRSRRPGADNLRSLLARFLDAFEPARLASRAAVSRSRLIGAPIRTGLKGAALGRPGLLVAGEAAGTTYAFSGEGIGKAIETGMLAAETIAAAVRADTDPGVAAAGYARGVDAAFASRFRAYEAAQRYLAYPAVADLLTWRARSSHALQQALEGMFRETTPPDAVFSLAGLVRAVLH